MLEDHDDADERRNTDGASELEKSEEFETEMIIRRDACDPPLLATFVTDLFRPRRRLEVENLFLRRAPRHLRGSERALVN